MTLVGATLLLPPVAGMSAVDLKLGGVPTPLVFVFVVWAILIGGAVVLARPLRESHAGAPSADTLAIIKSDTPR